MPTLTVVGPGKLGRSLANCLQQADLVTIKQVFSRNMTRAQAAVAVIGAGEPVCEWGVLQESDYLLLSVADEAIAEACAQLAAHAPLTDSTVVFHVSGIYASDYLAPLAKRGAAVASLHPVRSFSGEALLPSAFANTCCVIEGDATAKERLGELFSKLGANIVELQAADKPRYHAAMVLLANYTVTLTAEAEKLLQSLGLNAAVSKQLLLPLLDSVVTNLRHLPTASALTGPLQRGETTTIEKHLQALPDGKVKDLYRLLGELTVTDVLSCDEPLKQQLLDVLVGVYER